MSAHVRPPAGAVRNAAAVIAPGLRHAALVLCGFTLLFGWLFSRPLIEGTYLAETDLYEYYLPIFLSPPTIWSHYEFGGMPAFADPENANFYPLRWIFGIGGWWTAFLLSAYVLGACFTYAYVYYHTRSRGAAALAGLVFGLSEAMLERLAHPSMVHVFAWLPLVFLALDRIAGPRHRWAWAAVGAVAGANCVLAGHPQVPLYVAYVALAYVAIGARLDGGGWRHVATAGVMAAVASLLAAVTLLPLIEVSNYIVRQAVGFEDFTTYANSAVQTLSILFPSIAHVGRESPTYVGLAALMLAPLGAARTRANWRAAFWLALAIVALLLGAGDQTPLARFAYELPFYDRFRVVSRHLVFAAFGLSVLAGFGLVAIARREISRRAVVTSIAGLWLVLAVAAVVLGRSPDGFAFDSGAGAAWLWTSGMRAQFWLATVLSVACCGVWFRPRGWTFALVLIAATDLLNAGPHPVDLRGTTTFTVTASDLAPSVHAVRLGAHLHTQHQRMLSPSGANVSEVVPAAFARLWMIPIAGGYSSIMLDSTARLARMREVGSVDRAVLGPEDRSLDLLAVKYVVLRRQSMRPETRLYLDNDARWHLVDVFSTSRYTDRFSDEDVEGEREFVVFENRRALPRSWLVRETVSLDESEMIDAVRSSLLPEGRLFDPAHTALVDADVPSRIHPDGDAEVAVKSVRNGSIAVDVSSSGGFLVLSESYYPGWYARVGDGARVPVSRANLALQGVEVRAGRHLVTFEFDSTTLRIGIAGSGLGAIALAAMTIAAWRRRPR